jgi:2-C-methyl-D-erythritol 4-phosphate cytidylyltransferase
MKKYRRRSKSDCDSRGRKTPILKVHQSIHSLNAEASEEEKAALLVLKCSETSIKIVSLNSLIEKVSKVGLEAIMRPQAFS